MDLFNRKKVKELERELQIVREEFERKQGELATYKRFNELEHISTQTIEENQKLIKWIMNILDTFGTMEVRNRNNIQIPVYKEKLYRAYDSNYMGIYEKERITIPSITLIKMG